MENRQATRVGRPGDTILNKIEKVAKGENWSVVVECRDFEGKPLADPENVDFIVTIGENERDENPFIELHTWDPQIALLDPAKASFMASFKRSDQVLMAEGVTYFINYWTEPKDKSLEGRMLQARDAIRLLPSVEPKFVSSGRLAAVGFPSLLGSTSLTPYEIDPRDGFSGGKAPVGYVSTIDGVTLAIEGTLSLDRDQLVDRDITVTAFDGRGDVRSTIFHQTTYEALSFVGLASVEADRQDGGTVSVVLAGGWAGGYGARTYTANAGTISGSNLILPISSAGETTITVTATDEDGNTVPGSLQLTVEEVAPVIVAPTAAGALADLTLTEGVAMEPVDLSGDFTNGAGTLAFSLAPSSAALPAGLALSSVGVLSGTPTATVSGATVVVRATNSAGFADSGFSLTINAAFQNIAGRVSTGTADLVMAPVAGPDPAATTEFFYLTVPATGFSPSTVLKYVFSDATHESYVSFDSSGNTYVGVYARVGGTLQAQQTFSFTTDPLQPNDVAVIALVGSAGGTFALRQSRNEGDWVDGGSVPAAAGATFPVYGETIDFFGQDVILEGAYVFAFDTLPAILADVAAMNAAKASLIGTGGRRPTIDTIKAALGTPVYAIHGPAATITNNPGTAGGTYTQTGTITDYVPAAYAPTIVEWSNMQLAITTAAGADAGYLLVQASQAYMDAGQSGNAHMWRAVKYGGTSSLRTNNSAQATAAIIYETATGTSPGNSSSTMGADIGEMMGTLFLMRVDLARQTLWAMTGDSPMAQRDQDALSGVVRLPIRDTPMTLGASNKRTQSSGYAVWALNSLPAGFDPVANRDKFFDDDGNCVDPATTAAYLGAQPLFSTVGKNADQLAAGEYSGTETGTMAVQAGTDGAFTTIQEGSAGGGGQPSGSIIATSDSDADLLSGQAANYSITEAVAASFGTIDYDYSGVSISADRLSVVAGETIYLSVAGMTEEQMALWGFPWEFGTSGEFQFIQDLPWHIRQKNRSIGHQATVAWDTPGTKTVTLTIVPPAWTGYKMKRLTLDIENRDPDTEFSGRTVIVDTSGAFTGAPASVPASDRVTTWTAAMNKLKGWNGGRARFLRGDTVTVAATGEISRAFQSGVMFDDWGNSADPLPFLDTSQTFVNWSRPEPCPFYLIKNIEHAGTYDGLTGDTTGSQLCYKVSAESAGITFNGCKFHNMLSSIDSTNGPKLPTNWLGFWDCDITAWEDYGIYVATVGRVLIRGNAIYQDPAFPVSMSEWDPGNPGINAKNYGGPYDYANHGPIRLTQMDDCKVVVCGNRGFSFTGWTGGSPFKGDNSITTIASQPFLRCGALNCENMDALIAENYTEGGGYTLGGGNAGYIVGAGFVVMQSNYHLFHGSFNSSGGGCTGLWVINNIFVIPGSPAITNNNSSFQPFGELSDDTVTALWGTKDAHIRNNTVVHMGSLANGRLDIDRTFDEVFKFDPPSKAGPTVYQENNLYWMPNYTLTDRAAPLVPDGIYDAGTYGPAPLYKGWNQVDGNHVEGLIVHGLDTTYATPAGGRHFPALADGSAEIDASVGDLVPALDHQGRIRLKKDRGAVSRDVLKPVA